MSYTTPLYTLQEWQAAQDIIATLQRQNAALREALVKVRPYVVGKLPYGMLDTIDAVLTPTKEEK